MMTLLKRVYSLQAALPAVPPAAVWSAAQRAGSTDINCAAEERGDEEPGEGTPSWYIILGAAVLSSLIAVIVAIIVGGIILCRRGTKKPDHEEMTTTDFSESEFSAGTETADPCLRGASVENYCSTTRVMDLSFRNEHWITKSCCLQVQKGS